MKELLGQVGRDFSRSENTAVPYRRETRMQNSTLPEAPALLLMRNITKAFPGVLANDRVNLEVRAGEVHALLGENGAGKTTLMHILYGLVQPDAGDIMLRGQPVCFRSPCQAIAAGIGLVPQHFLLVRRHTVAENVALGLPGSRFFFPQRGVAHRIRRVAPCYGLAVEPDAVIGQLSAGEQQRVEILKALLRQADILILDEPTSVLTPRETEALFQVIARMKAAGHAIIFITHKLLEVMDIADHVTVLRQGQVVATLPCAVVDQPTLARLMVGREVPQQRLPRQSPVGEPVFTVAHLWVNNDGGLPALRDVSFTVHGGEILGVAGVAGNGQRELSEALTGLRRPAAGQVQLHGQEVTRHSARALSAAGVAHIPEDRQRLGIVPAMSVADNLMLRLYRQAPFATGLFLRRRRMTQFARQAITTYDMAVPSPATPARLLSGGTIQRLILARELAGRPAVIVAAHPTYGLDVGATAQIHQLLLQQRQQGAAVLLVSEDLDEVLQLSDRILVLCGGEVMGLLAATAADREHLGMLMAGAHQAMG
jgi:general nucleoside transport system ATP-binding protein